jgi:hypothetical protein
MKHRLFLILVVWYLPISSFAQVKFGQLTSEDLELTQVEYESDANAVVLYESGDSRFSGSMLETTYHIRIKILNEAGKDYGDVRIKYYVGDNRTESIFGEKAQITTIVEGQQVTSKLGKESFFDVDLGEGYREFRISFPNAQIGSILDYTYKKLDKNITFLDGWNFQNNIPTLISKYQITIIPQLDYKMMGQGNRFFSDAEKSGGNGIYSWTIRNLYAMKPEPYMINYRDYAERVEFQLSRYQKTDDTKGGFDWVDLMNTWEKLGDEIIDIYQEKGFYRSNPIEKEMLSIDLTGDSQLEKAKKAYYFLRDNFVVEGEDWIYPTQNLPQVLKTKMGTPGEMNLALMGVLKSMGIQCDPILIGSKGSGRSDLVSFPFLTQFDEILIYAEIDGQPQYLDLSNKMAPFGYVDLNKHVKAGLILQKNKSELTAINIKHSSNTSVLSQIELDDDSNLVINSTLRFYNYKGLQIAQTTKNLLDQKKPLEDFFKQEEGEKIEVITSEDNLAEKNYHTIATKKIIENLADHETIIFTPLQFSTFFENPFTQTYRVFPVDFGYSFNESYSTNIKIPAGYEIDDYPVAENLSISGGGVQFLYDVQLMATELLVNAKLMVRLPLIGADQYAELKYLMESVSSKLSAPVVMKKIIKP